jgi:histone H3/H4
MIFSFSGYDPYLNLVPAFSQETGSYRYKFFNRSCGIITKEKIMPEKKTAPQKELPMLVVSSKLKDFIKEEGGEDTRMAGDFPEALNEQLVVLVKRAVARCKARGAKTVSPADA